MADSGSVSTDYEKIAPLPALEQTRVEIYPYQSKSTLTVRGKFTAEIIYNSITHNEIFYVAQVNSGSLLSWRTSTDLDLIKVVKPLQPQAASSVEQLNDRYKDLFQGLRKLKNLQVKLHIDGSVPPVAQPHRRVPFHVRKQL